MNEERLEGDFEIAAYGAIIILMLITSSDPFEKVFLEEPCSII
jgi:hypothetical protein